MGIPGTPHIICLTLFISPHSIFVSGPDLRQIEFDNSPCRPPRILCALTPTSPPTRTAIASPHLAYPRGPRRPDQRHRQRPDLSTSVRTYCVISAIFFFFNSPRTVDNAARVKPCFSVFPNPSPVRVPSRAYWFAHIRSSPRRRVPEMPYVVIYIASGPQRSMRWHTHAQERATNRQRP